jgi:hypothetical protein
MAALALLATSTGAGAGLRGAVPVPTNVTVAAVTNTTAVVSEQEKLNATMEPITFKGAVPRAQEGKELLEEALGDVRPTPKDCLGLPYAPNTASVLDKFKLKEDGGNLGSSWGSIYNPSDWACKEMRIMESYLNANGKELVAVLNETLKGSGFTLSEITCPDAIPIEVPQATAQYNDKCQYIMDSTRKDCEQANAWVQFGLTFNVESEQNTTIQFPDDLERKCVKKVKDFMSKAVIEAHKPGKWELWQILLASFSGLSLFGAGVHAVKNPDGCPAHACTFFCEFLGSCSSSSSSSSDSSLSLLH